MLLPEQLSKLHVLTKYVSMKRLTQAELARATGVHQSQISRVLSGDVRRASKNVIKLCKYAESLPTLDEATEEDREAVTSDLMSLLGRKPAEDAALRQIITGLRAWRSTWAGEG